MDYGHGDCGPFHAESEVENGVPRKEDVYGDTE